MRHGVTILGVALEVVQRYGVAHDVGQKAGVSGWLLDQRVVLGTASREQCTHHASGCHDLSRKSRRCEDPEVRLGAHSAHIDKES
jgi:hypothetical protein